MSANAANEDVRIIAAAYEDRVKDLFKVFVEAVATGEPDREGVVRFKRGLASARRVYELAVEAARPEAA